MHGAVSGVNAVFGVVRWTGQSFGAVVKDLSGRGGWPEVVGVEDVKTSGRGNKGRTRFAGG